MRSNNYKFILLQVSFVAIFSAPNIRFVPNDLNILSGDYSMIVASPRDPWFASLSRYKDEAKNYITPTSQAAFENSENYLVTSVQLESNNRENARMAKSQTSMGYFDSTTLPEYSFISVSGDIDHQHIGFGTINPGNNLLESYLYEFVHGYVLPQAGFGEISLRYSSPTSGVGSVELPQQEYWAQQTFTGDTTHENNEQIFGEMINTDFKPSEQAGLMLVHDNWSAIPAPYYEYDDIAPAISAPYYSNDDAAPAYNDIENHIEKPTSLYEVHGLPDPDPEYLQLPQPSYAYRSPQDFPQPEYYHTYAAPEPSQPYNTPYQNAGSSGPYEGNYFGQSTNTYRTQHDNYSGEYRNNNIQSTGYNPSKAEDRLGDWWLPTMMSLGVSETD
jgi:hypothetical protein